jgi:hypothetical protein
MMGAPVPTDVLVEALHLPFVLDPDRERRQQSARGEREPARRPFLSGTEIVYVC